MDKRLEELNKKISFYYEINDKLYAIGHNQVFDNNNFVTSNVKSSFNIYNQYNNLSEEKMSENDEIELAKIMFQMVLFSNNELNDKDNVEKIKDIKTFWATLNEVEKDSVFKQVEKFKYILKKVKLNIRYPGLSGY